MIIDNRVFYKCKDGYYISGTGENLIRLHVYIWEKVNGNIPKGFCIHHKDHNKDNNNISNLGLMNSHDHQSYHSNLIDKDILRENMINNVRPKADKWHGSEAGIEWHKKHYKSMKEKLYTKVENICKCCGEKYITVKGSKNKFCSSKCKSKYRRDMKLDHIDKVCEVCQNIYRASKYQKTKYC